MNLGTITEVKAEANTQRITIGLHVEDSTMAMVGDLLTKVNMTKEMS